MSTPQGAEDREAQVAHIEVTLLEVLEGAPGLMVGMAGQVHLAVLANDAAGGVDEDRGVVAAGATTLESQLGRAQTEARFQSPPLTRHGGRP